MGGRNCRGKCGSSRLRVESLSRFSHSCPSRVPALIPSTELRNPGLGEPGPLCCFRIQSAFTPLISFAHHCVLLERLQGKLPHVGGKEVGWTEKNHFPFAWAQDPPRKKRKCPEPSEFFHLSLTLIECPLHARHHWKGRGAHGEQHRRGPCPQGLPF